MRTKLEEKLKAVEVEYNKLAEERTRATEYVEKATQQMIALKASYTTLQEVLTELVKSSEVVEKVEEEPKE